MAHRGRNRKENKKAKRIGSIVVTDGTPEGYK
jgi:hypothetical protein